MRCPGCGGPAVPDELQFGLYQCAQCGEVEIDGSGAYVGGRFYEFGNGGDGSALEEWEETPEEYSPTWEDVFATDDTVSPFEE
jgi:hypothetical protein